MSNPINSHCVIYLLNPKQLYESFYLYILRGYNQITLLLVYMPIFKYYRFIHDVTVTSFILSYHPFTSRPNHTLMCIESDLYIFIL